MVTSPLALSSSHLAAGNRKFSCRSDKGNVSRENAYRFARSGRFQHAWRISISLSTPPLSMIRASNALVMTRLAPRRLRRVEAVEK